jgi:poly(beta-D-mannuronate) lyase
VVLLLATAGCSESYALSRVVDRAMDREVDDMRVIRQGAVLVRPETRRAELAGMARAARQALCGPLRPAWSAPAPLPRLATSYGGPDNRSEPFALTVMETAAAAFGLDDEAARQTLARLLAGWAAQGALLETDDATNAYYALERTLLPTLAGYALIRDSKALAPGDRDRIDHWLRDLVELRDGRASEDSASGQNNHAYLSASVDAAYGALAGDAQRLAAGIEVYREALADMRRDGSLPRETERGARALWYQRHAIASLVTIAAIAEVQGLDLWNEQARGHSLHTAIRFLLDAIEEPRRVWAYAEADVNSGTAAPWDEQDLSFLERRGHVRHYMAWAEIYIGRFPERREAHRLQAILAHHEPTQEPLVDDYSGGNTSCLFRRSPAR